MINYPRIIAHRCGGALAPENSLVGLDIAARINCRGVEFDVMLSADDVPVVIHDETLDRTTTGIGSVATMTVKKIQQFDASSKHHKSFGVAPVPTFSDVMARVGALDLWANVEIKPAQGYEVKTGAVVGQWLADHWTGKGVISSFSQDALLAALNATQTNKRNFSYAMLFEKLPKNWSLMLAKTGANAIHLSGKQITSRDADALNTLGVPWACFTINSIAEASRLFSLGCAAVFTDRPDLWTADEMVGR